MLNPNDDNLIESTITALDAYLDSLSSGLGEVPAALADRTDADAILRRLQMLLHAKKISEAADLVRGRDPNERWCDRAISALVMNGESDHAKCMIGWAESSDNIGYWHLCLLRYAEASIAYIVGKHDPFPLAPGVLEAEESSSLQDSVTVIQPLIDFVLAKKRIDTEVESRAAQVSLHLAFLLQEKKSVDQLVRMLVPRTPIPFILAQVAFWRGRVEPDDLPERLRAEHAASFECRLMAAMIEGELQGKPDVAFRSAMQLIDDTSSAKERERLFAALTELAPICGEKECAEVERVAKTLLSDSPSAMKLFEAGVLLREGKTTEAGEALEGLRDDSNPIWHQIYANYLIQKGEGISALEHLKAANEHLNHPDMCRKIAETAYRYDQLEDAIAALEQLLSIQSHDTRARINLAGLYADRKDYNKAIVHLSVLRELEPEEVRHHLNYAACLARSGDTQGAIEVYNEICQAARPPLQAILDRAQVMRSIGQVQEAFNSLIPYKDSYWEAPAYLYELQDLGFASQNEGVAGEALHQMQRLQAEGRIGPEALRTMDIDSAVEMLKEGKEQQDKISEQVLLGRLPWPMAEIGFRRVPYWGWMARTQPAGWIGDDPIGRSSYTVYSTNGFGIRAIDDRLSLEPIPLPQQGAEVVADISALITLHRLGLLGKAAEYFGKIIVPAIYVAQALEDGSRLAFHQLSQKTSLEQIKRAVETKRMWVLGADEETSKQEYPYVNEYAKEDGSEKHAYSLRDVAAALCRDGRFDDEKKDRLSKLARAQSGVGPNHPELLLSQKILLDLTTLKTTATEGLLDPLVKAFKVYIEPQAYAGVVDDVRAIAAQEDVQRWHADLWKQIRSEPRFVQASYTTPKELKNDDHSNHEVGFASCILAGQMDVPLLADDRVLQAVACNTHREPRASFGTNELILALGKDKLITRDEVANGLKQLIDWRYRFIAVPSDVLKTMADHYRKTPPGLLLRDVARYLHDCMRDAGLFTGPVKTSPPSSIGLRLYQEWRRTIIEFVIDVWADARFSDESAERLTRWAMTEFLPSIPTTIPQPQQARIGSIDSPRTRIVDALLNIHKVGDAQRGNRALRTIADALGVDNADYLKAVTGVIDYAST